VSGASDLNRLLGKRFGTLQQGADATRYLPLMFMYLHAFLRLFLCGFERLSAGVMSRPA